MPYDALLVLSFGGPEGRDEVVPFLENVLRGKNIPRERMLEVAEHYYHFDGISPINSQCRALIAALENELATLSPSLPIYWGNRNWRPYLADTVLQMRDDGVRKALVLVTSAFSSYSGCRQYLEDIERARQAVGANAPQIDKLRSFFNHPGFLEPMVLQTRAALEAISSDRRATTQLVFTAHSIPLAMAAGSPYVRQLEEACGIIAEKIPMQSWTLAYQSRSGPPSQPWLEPDVGDLLRRFRAAGNCTDAVVVPIGFISDHMEVLFDLDTELKQLCNQLGMALHRVPTVGTHPLFISAIRELILERTSGLAPRWLGQLGPCPDVCAATCCPSGRPMKT